MSAIKNHIVNENRGVRCLARQIAPIVALITLSFPLMPPAFACEESGTGVPVHFSGIVKSGETFSKDIQQNYYFAEGYFFQKVKVPGKDGDSPPLFFWLVPDNFGWQIKIGPAQNISPDYIAITTWPNPSAPSLHIDKSTQVMKRSFCFNALPQDYDDAVSEIQKTGKSGMAEILSNACTNKDDGYMGFGAFRIQNVTAEQLKFTVDLTVPVYTTSCPPP